MHPVDDRASETFCQVPATQARHLGIDGRLFPPSSPAFYERFYRRKRRGWQLGAFLYWYATVLPRRLVQLARARNTDVVFVQRSMFRWRSPPILEWLTARVLRKPIAYHLDDGIYLEARRAWSVKRCRIAARVVTGNELTAAFAREAGTEVAPIEYAVDASAYPVKEHADTSPVYLGYTGIYPEEHLAPIAEPLLAVCQETEARVRIVGGLKRPSLGALDPFTDWSPWNSRDVYSWARDFDIGLMPLTDTQLHRAKEPLKVKEYMAAGLPMVLSPVGHNLQVVRDGVDGFFAGSSAEWHDRLVELVRDPELRARLGASGRDLVLERYDMPRLLEELADLFSELAGSRGAATSRRPAAR
jgi:glycosyltransferase involved in cell wall biosynthesis